MGALRNETTKSQAYNILTYLRMFGGITDVDAYTKLHIRRLSARIWDLRKKGYRIESRWIDSRTFDGKPCRYVKYILHSEVETNDEH